MKDRKCSKKSSSIDLNFFGFTMIEFLSAVVILGAIAVITTPVVLGIISKSDKAAFKESCYGIFDGVSYYLNDHNLQDIPEEGIAVDEMNLKNSNQIISGTVYKDSEGKTALSNVSNGKYCATGSKRELVIKAGTCDVTGPVITFTPETLIILKGYNFNLNDATFEDPETGISQSSITLNGSTVSTTTSLIKGTYTVVYSATNGNNITTTKNRTVIVLEAGDLIKNYNYTGSVQELTVLYDGNYKLSVCGASGGGTAIYNGKNYGYGGCAYGQKTLTAGTRLYIYVGGKGEADVGNASKPGGFNGGGAGGSGGGGATDIRLIQASAGSWYNLSHASFATDTSLLSRIIVGGAGGGSDDTVWTEVKGSYTAAPCTAATNDGLGGYGGGLVGGNGYNRLYNLQGAAGGTQSTGYSLGLAGNGLPDNGGGGGGYYGGYGGGSGNYGGGGGSSYIGGLSNATVTSGVNNGNGYASIEFLSVLK